MVQSSLKKLISWLFTHFNYEKKRQEINFSLLETENYRNILNERKNKSTSKNVKIWPLFQTIDFSPQL